MIQIINKVDVKLPDVQIEKIVTLIHKLRLMPTSF